MCNHPKAPRSKCAPNNGQHSQCTAVCQQCATLCQLCAKCAQTLLTHHADGWQCSVQHVPVQKNVAQHSPQLTSTTEDQSTCAPGASGSSSQPAAAKGSERPLRPCASLLVLLVRHTVAKSYDKASLHRRTAQQILKHLQQQKASTELCAHKE